jgi:hypothetical protein
MNLLICIQFVKKPTNALGFTYVMLLQHITFYNQSAFIGFFDNFLNLIIEWNMERIKQSFHFATVVTKPLRAVALEAETLLCRQCVMTGHYKTQI